MRKLEQLKVICGIFKRETRQEESRLKDNRLIDDRLKDDRLKDILRLMSQV